MKYFTLIAVLTSWLCLNASADPASTNQDARVILGTVARESAIEGFFLEGPFVRG